MRPHRGVARCPHPCIAKPLCVKRLFWTRWGRPGVPAGGVSLRVAPGWLSRRAGDQDVRPATQAEETFLGVPRALASGQLGGGCAAEKGFEQVAFLIGFSGPLAETAAASGAVPTMQDRADCLLNDFRSHQTTVSHRGGHGRSAAPTEPTYLEIADLDVPAKRCCLEWHGCVGYQPH